MPGRKFSAGSGYRYGFNGKEKDNEDYGEGNAYDFGARIYDNRLGRWLSSDPLHRKMPSFSPYNFCGGNPILMVDPDGKVLRIHGGNDEKNKFKALLNAGFANQIKVEIDNNGIVTLHGQTNNLNPKQLALFTSLNTIISNAKTTDAVLLSKAERNKAFIGGWEGSTITEAGVTKKVNTIDVYDAEAIGNSKHGISAHALISHELVETFQGQVNNKLYPDAHKQALNEQGAIDGITVDSQWGFDIDGDNNPDKAYLNYSPFLFNKKSVVVTIKNGDPQEIHAEKDHGIPDGNGGIKKEGNPWEKPVTDPPTKWKRDAKNRSAANGIKII